MLTLDQTRNAWDSLAGGYDKLVTPTNISLAEEALRLVGLRAGMKFLDVAAGTGALSLPAARLGAQVLATDISPAMIELLDAQARREGLSELKSRIMDGQALDLEDDAFDVAGSQYGVMLMPDFSRALKEMVRVTKPGGRVLIIAFGHPEDVEFLSFFMKAMKTAVPGFTGLPMDPPPLPFQIADPEKLRQEMVKANLRDIRVERRTHKLEFKSAKHLLDHITSSNPIGTKLVADMTEEQRLAVQHVLDGLLRERAGGVDTAILSHPVNIAIGSK